MADEHQPGMLRRIEQRMPAMSKQAAFHLSRLPVRLTLPNLRGWLSAWWRKRENARILAGLSPEQLHDCGLESPRPNVPIIEVPRELLRRLPSSLHIG